MTKEILRIVLTCDVENDFSSVEKDSLYQGSPQLQWLGVEKGIPLILNIIKDFEDDFGNNPIFTWFVRADNQLKELYGNSIYLLERYANLWNSLRKEHDIGWHPHLYRKYKGRWIQETRRKHLVKSLRETYEELEKRGLTPMSSRIGEGFMSNTVMGELSKLRIKIDSTAMPGRMRKDSFRKFDWGPTPQDPYPPSKNNYQVPGDNSLDILEVPMSMIRTKTEYDRTPLLRYINLSFHSGIVNKGIKEFIKRNNLLVSVVHPFEILQGVYGGRHPLISFDFKEMKRNIETILYECRRANKEARFIKISDIK